ncbi:hypothetical protein AMJ40_01945 [candidate division TA06 bacterium DG_26]|uniref:Rod shape-determining protein RodA n=1 Tax=candidate division TA06 bacterium DG_26 TaxID=1703771 RepID=A0A0S7WLJ7_UNCT6|nr:MAG: hypothetical protein AMJ40_01945 [candidate division TA06 bacterium DG_26]
MQEGRRAGPLDLWVVAALILLLVFGSLIVYSATEGEYVKRHGAYILLGGLALLFAYTFHFRNFWALSYFIWLGSVALLTIPLLTHSQEVFARRWVDLGFIRFQPSEFAKIGLILALARNISAKQFDPRKLKSLIAPIGIFLLPFGLTVVEPDLTTALVFCVILVGMFIWRGVSLFYILILVTPVLSVVLSFHHVFWGIYMALLLVGLLVLRRSGFQIFSLFAMNSIVGVLNPILLKDYQRSRIASFVNPSGDPRGSGWSIFQSKIAIGSGGILGKGFMMGTQKKLAFLPAVHTDLAFSVVGEEFGFIGCVVILGLLFVLILRAITIASCARNMFGSLVALSAGLVLLSQTVINVGMNLGLVPVAGIPLPFVSYGGSSLLVSMALVGLLLNIHRRRFDY